MLMFSYLVLPFLLFLSAIAVPAPSGSGDALQRRTDPFFPDQPPSCPICARDYPSINSCAQAAPVLQNFTNIIFNPGAFIDVIQCACTDTFKSVFPQCVDCFLKTGQEHVLNSPNLPAVVDGMRKICSLASSLLGNVSFANGEATPLSSSNPPRPTSAAASTWEVQMRSVVLMAITVITLGVGSLVL